MALIPCCSGTAHLIACILPFSWWTFACFLFFSCSETGEGEEESKAGVGGALLEMRGGGFKSGGLGMGHTGREGVCEVVG